MWRIIVLINFLLLTVIWCHHCDDPDNPFIKLSECTINKQHFCYNLVEDMNSFTCRCSEDSSCKEPCGINIFRAWSSSEGSWVRTLKRANRVPVMALSSYATCVKVPGTPKPPHKLPYTMCMCNDHYYSYGYAISAAQKRNFSKEFLEKLRYEKPRMHILGSENYLNNLPYIKFANYSYRACKDISQGESYHPTGFLGKDWCNLKYCQDNNPYGKGNPNVTYSVMKCAETCTCFLEPSPETLAAAVTRNKLVEGYELNRNNNKTNR